MGVLVGMFDVERFEIIDGVDRKLVVKVSVDDK